MKNINLNLGYSTEGYTYEEAVQDYMITDEGYLYPLEPLFIKDDEFEVFIEELLNEFQGTQIFDYNSGKNFHQVYKHNNFHIMVRGNVKEKYIYSYSKTQETSEYIFQLHKKCSTQESSVQIFMTTYGEKEKSTKLIDIEEFNDISKLYYPYIDTDTMFQQFFTGSENIMILAGLPGLGKTKLVSLMLKYAYNNTEYLPYDKMDIDIIENQFISVGRVKSTNVLASDQFWESIQKAQHDFIILDDLDFMLTKRESEVQTQDDVIRNQFLSQFLPFTDGIENNNTKFIITTNQTYEHMDSALLRKGRLFDILELRNLKVQEAKEIWLENSLKEEDFNTLFSNNSVVNPADLGSEIHKRTNKRIKNKTKNYLLEPEISKVQKARKNKKIML